MNIYMKVDGISGPVATGLYRGWFQLLEFQRPLTPNGNLARKGPGSAVLTRKFDASSAKFYAYVSTGKHIPTIDIEFVAAGAHLPEIQYQIDDITVDDYHMSGNAREVVSISFANVSVTLHQNAVAAALARLVPRQPRLVPFIGPRTN